MEILVNLLQDFYLDKVNKLVDNGQRFHYSRAYSYYSSLSAQEQKRRWSLGKLRDIFQDKEFQGSLSYLENLPSFIHGRCIG
jgi:hypothetical protein